MPVKVLKFDLDVGESPLSQSTLIEVRTSNPDSTADNSQNKDPTIDEVQARFKVVVLFQSSAYLRRFLKSSSNATGSLTVRMF